MCATLRGGDKVPVRQRVNLEQERFAILKTARAAIRLKHSLAADAEINKKLPELDAAISRALQDGKTYALDIASVINEA
jgi:hypothetical protein